MMIIANETQFKQNTNYYLEQSIEKPLRITTKKGNVVILSEDEYLSLQESLYILSNPTLKEKVLQGKATSLSECVGEAKVQW